MIDLEISTKPLPLVSISILDGAHSTALFKVKVSFPISMPNELMWTLPAYSQSPSLSWFLHFHHHHPCNQTLKQMFTFPGGISLPLLLLCLLHIEQNIFVDACNELHFLQKLCCNNLHICTSIRFSRQGVQVIVCPETWCATSQNHEG